MIKVENVSHKIGQSTILNNINLTIQNGGITALIGANGAGKSTLLSLIARLQSLQSGKITLDTLNLSETPSRQIAQHLAILTQDNVIHSRITVRDLLMFGRYPHHQGKVGEKDNQVVNEALQRFELAELESRYLSELSGGQRQRIAIARVMLKDAPILLLDEATSALDSEVEAAIQESLDKMMEGKTVIAIAHRLSTIAAMDRLIVLDKGRIVEEGTHAELLANNGLYAKLWAHQSGGFLPEQVEH